MQLNLSKQSHIIINNIKKTITTFQHEESKVKTKEYMKHRFTCYYWILVLVRLQYERVDNVFMFTINIVLLFMTNLNGRFLFKVNIQDTIST